MSKASRFLEELEKEMQRFTKEVKAMADAAVQVSELSAALRQANDRWKKLEGRVKFELERLEGLEGEVAAGLEQLETFKQNLIVDLKKALEDIRSEVHSVIAGEKEKLAETQNMIFKELQDHRDYLRTQLVDMTKRIDKSHKEALKAIAKADISQKSSRAASHISKWALFLAALVLGVSAWWFYQSFVANRV